MATIAQLNVNLAANTASFTKGMQNASKHVNEFQTAIKHLAGHVAAFVSMHKAVEFAASSFEAFEAREIALKQFEASLAATGDAAHVSAGALKRFAEERAKLTGVKATETIGAGSILATFANIQGETFFRVLKDSQDVASKFGMSMEGATRAIAKAVQDPEGGLKALKKLGISITDDQKKQIHNLLEQNNILGAQKIILDEIEHRFAGSAEAGATGVKKMTAELENFKAKLGESLGPQVAARAGEATSILEAIVPTAAGNEGAAIAERSLDFRGASVSQLQARIRENTAQRYSVVAAMNANPPSPSGPNAQFESLVSSLSFLFNESDALRRSLPKAEKLESAIKGTLSTTKMFSPGESLAQSILFGGMGRAPGAAKSVFELFTHAASRQLGLGGFAGTGFGQLGPLTLRGRQITGPFGVASALQEGSREAINAIARREVNKDDIQVKIFENAKEQLKASLRIDEDLKNMQIIPVENIA